MINFVIFSSYRNGGIGGRLLKQAAAEAGHRAAFVADLAEARSYVSKKQADVFIARFSHKKYHEAAKIGEFFEENGVLCAVSSKGILESFDKSKACKVFLKNGIATPETQLVARGGGYTPQEFPVVLKPLDENQGKNIFLAKTSEEYSRYAETLLNLYDRFILQEYVREAANKDTRAFVVGGKVVAAMERTAAEGGFLANLAAGGAARPVKLSAADSALAVRASKCFQAEFSGVDLIQSASGTMVLEVNCSPGFKISDITGINTAGLVIDHLVKRRLEHD